MPVQHSIFGRPFRLQMPPRRFVIVIGLAISILVILFVTASTSAIAAVATVEQLSEAAQHAADIIPRPNLPKLYNPFGNTAHEPPEQANSTLHDSTWYSDWKWLHPFSSMVTLDKDRAVLPPLRHRTAIYTFYDTSSKRDTAMSTAENELLLAWRRAWWAQGFKPVVLGGAEAMKHPLYQTLQGLHLEAGLQIEFERWLAWGHMDGGILANWLTLPMARYDDSMLSYLRRGEFPKLTRYKGLQNGLFVGTKDDVNAAIKQGLDTVRDKLKKPSNIIDALPSAFDVDSRPGAIAFYDLTTITSKYNAITEKLSKSRAEGYALLRQLINSHLHITWQNSFPDGISVLKPHPLHMTTLMTPAINLARDLSQCPETPMPSSCPPNRPSCQPCDSSRFLDITTPGALQNKSTVYTIGFVPHPYTFLSLDHSRQTLSTAFVRRNTSRDTWLKSITAKLLETGLSGPQRLVPFKEAVASEQGASRTLWLSAEQTTQNDLEWKFGFALPFKDGGTPNLPKVRPPLPRDEGPMPSETDLAREVTLLEQARKALKSTRGALKMDKEMVEAWNLADVEAWRFARAFEARRRVERKKWEEDEKTFAGAERTGWNWQGGLVG